jgi:CMP-N,N'-diacetyllegionaminic acid synthase
MSIIATICARGGSKGVPRKNIKNILGKPLIQYTIDQALACEKISGVYVSTDDEEIAEVARQAGAAVPFIRPEELATSGAAKVPVVQHLVKWLTENGVKVEVIVDLDPTSPLRTVSDISSCIDLLKRDVDIVITGYESTKNPYFNMVEYKSDGSIQLVCAGSNVVSRQTAPKVYAMNASIYVWHIDSLFAKGLWDGVAKLYIMPEDRSVDIDTALDFKLVELLMQEKFNYE